MLLLNVWVGQTWSDARSHSVSKYLSEIGFANASRSQIQPPQSGPEKGADAARRGNPLYAQLEI